MHEVILKSFFFFSYNKELQSRPNYKNGSYDARLLQKNFFS